MSIINFSVKLSHFNINISVNRVKLHKKQKNLRHEAKLRAVTNHRESMLAQFHSMNLY